MALEAYRSKRNFKATAEPKGRAPLERSNLFVVQKHDATRLHYDFRLALDGVLKSWAVTRGPSLVPGEKRLAVAVEDHPLEYSDFEGTIAEGEYGGGSVIVWDRGAWTPIGDPHRGLKKGQLDFELHGQKLKGRWHLVRMRAKPREKRENWLLIKGDDEYARSAEDPDILEERPESVKTGRLIDDVAGEPPGWSSKTGKIERADGAAGKPDSVALKPKAADPCAVEGVVKAPCPASSSQCWRRWRSPLRAAIGGCMKSSSTAIGSRRGSRTAGSRYGPAGGSIGRRNLSAPLRRRFWTRPCATP